MKKVTYVPVKAIPAKPATKRRVEQTICDVCLEGIKSGQRIAVCVSCGREMHGYDWSRPASKPQCIGEDPHDGGDYPDKYCRFCYHLKYGKYAERYSDIERDYEDALDNMDRIVKKESLESIIS